jgi:hypothetical protein
MRDSDQSKRTVLGERAPAFQFYPRQFAGDDQVMGMDLGAIGAHILLICAAASSPDRYRIHADEYAIRMRLRNPTDDAWQKIKKQLLAGAWKISEDGKWWIQSGLERTFQKQKDFSEKQSGRAKARWGRNDVESTPVPSRTDAAEMPETMPEACSSSSSSSSKQNITSASSGSDSNSARREKSPLAPSEAGLRLAQMLKGYILQNNPQAKATEGQVQKWALEADRMVRLDGRTHQQIADLIDFSQKDSFWLTNILSMGKLRKHFDQLTNQRKRKQQASPNSGPDESVEEPLARPKWLGLDNCSDQGEGGK